MPGDLPPANSPADPPTDYVAGLRAMVGHAPLNLMGAVGLVLDGNGRVLLQKLAGREVWGLPGGLCELAEPPETTLCREETGLVVLAAELLTLLTTPLRTLPNGHRVSFYTAVYRVTEWSGVPVPDGVEGTELRFFAPDDLPLPLRGQPGAWAADWLSRVP